jgi:peptidoglycan hydrolase-like protein with peptidoglycan-binding domain
MAIAAVCIATSIAEVAQAAPRSFGSRLLAKPMRGPDVRVLQRLLTQWGLPTSVDGQFGRQTKSRVRSWERHSDRTINGRVSRADAAALRAAVARGERLPGTEPEPDVTTQSTEKATIGPDGLAIAPASAPPEVQAIIAAGNEIHDKPYKYGGGHARWQDTGYDCSGSMSYALRGAGLLDQALDSTGFMSWGERGKGQWVTNYANAGHSYMIVAGLRFDTSGREEDGSRWHTEMRSASGYTVRHPPGL